MGKQRPQPSDLELQILGVLWRNGPSTVRQILEAMPDGKKRAYTSLLSVMQVMQKKGLLSHSRSKDGLAYVYRAKVTRRQVLGPFLRGLVTKVFGGSPTAAVQQLLAENDVSQEELSQLREFLDELDHKQQSGLKDAEDEA
jgi:BlaI family transcriptional regulator, penicillinase repressor